jgi:hypothetical protein
MKYKLRGDYCFKTAKNDILRNKRDADGNVTEAVVIDSKVHEKAIAEQLHMLEAIVEKKPAIPPEKTNDAGDTDAGKEPDKTIPPEKTNDQQPTSSEQSNTEQQSLPLQAGSNQGSSGRKGNR